MSVLQLNKSKDSTSPSNGSPSDVVLVSGGNLLSSFPAKIFAVLCSSLQLTSAAPGRRNRRTRETSCCHATGQGLLCSGIGQRC